MRAMLILAIFASTLFLPGCIETPPGCTTDAECMAWQRCNLTLKACQSATGYCDFDSECNSELLRCDTNITHTCVFIPGRCNTSLNCEPWQVCSSDNHCQPAPGFCSDNNQCDALFEYCNPSSHKCSPKPGFCNADTDCNSWEKCDTQSRKCFLMQGRCVLDSDCASWQACDLKTRLCIAKTGFCANDEGCPSWAKCDPASNKCIPRAGYCDADNQCNQWEFCSSKTHRCTVMADRCGTKADCGWWQICTKDNHCRAAVGYCTFDSDCVAGERCNEQTHLCQ